MRIILHNNDDDEKFYEGQIKVETDVKDNVYLLMNHKLIAYKSCQESNWLELDSKKYFNKVIVEG